MKYIQVRIDALLHKKFKRKCLEDEIEMSEKIREWIKKYIGG